MFGNEFYPTPEPVITEMLYGYNVEGKVVLEPSAGKGNIVDYCAGSGAATIIACEKDQNLRKILSGKCHVIAEDFFTVTSEKVSHVDFIIMNPPFSNAEQHIMHAWNIAPPGCTILALCNQRTVSNPYSTDRARLSSLVNEYGGHRNLGNAFNDAERKTDVDVALLHMIKPGEKADQYSGFFLDEEPEDAGADGIMKYDFIRDVVNRYVGALKIYDEQLETAQRLYSMTNTFFLPKEDHLCVTVNADSYQRKRNEFRKEMQKEAWAFIINKMGMDKYATRGLMEDINRFVESQQKIPFTMRNIYHMIEIVIGTHAQRMDKAMLEAFEKVTKHYSDNRFYVEGWKTNSHYLLNQTFIIPWMVDTDRWSWNENHVKLNYSDNSRIIQDLVRVLCYMTGMPYENTTPLDRFVSRGVMEYGKWYSWGFFEIKGYKKGTMHFKFQNPELCDKFNQNIARILGYPLFEGKEQTAYQQRQTGRAKQKKAAHMAC